MQLMLAREVIDEEQVTQPLLFLNVVSYRGLLCSIVNCRIGAGILFQYKGCLLYVQSMLTELAFGSLWKVFFLSYISGKFMVRVHFA